MDIEISAENVMSYMEDENLDESKFKTENMLIQSIEDAKKDKEDKKETRYLFSNHFLILIPFYSRYKSINDFKARVLDLLNIYVKEMKGSIPGDKRMIITKGLLDAMAVAHYDKSSTLFEKLKKVIVTMAKETKATEGEDDVDEKNHKTILFTEILTKILNPKMDAKVTSVYRTAFFYIIKSLKEDKDFRKLIRSSYKELLKCYLQKRASNTLTQ